MVLLAPDTQHGLGCDCWDCRHRETKRRHRERRANEDPFARMQRLAEQARRDWPGAEDVIERLFCPYGEKALHDETEPRFDDIGFALFDPANLAEGECRQPGHMRRRMLAILTAERGPTTDTQHIKIQVPGAAPWPT